MEVDHATEAPRATSDPEALANFRDGAPERFVPGILAGRLIEAEHLSRYHWACQFAAGRRVLDVACGAGYGSVLLSRAGAETVVGIDAAQALIDAVAPEMPDGVELRVGDVCALDEPDGAFDLVVSFETIEHVERPVQALAELVRVLAPDGLLIVSTPERRMSGENNPHHIHELTRDELESELLARVRHVAMFRQQALLSSAIAPEPGLTDELAGQARTRRLSPPEDGLAYYVIALAGRGELPPARPFLGVTTRMDFQIWQQFLERAADDIQQRDRRIDELDDRLLDHEELQDRLIAAEQRLLKLTELEQLNTELKEQCAAAENEMQILRERIERADRVWRDVQASPSWRLTKPLRALKQALKG